MRPRYEIFKKDSSYIGLEKLCSMVRKGDYVIIARYNVNKTTLRKILNDYIKNSA